METIVFVIVFISAVLAILVTLNQLSQRMDAANQQLKQISKHLGLHEEALEQIEEELKDLVRQGERIEAIKLYRAKTGSGLKEAHEHIEELRREEKDADL
ncbi:MAG: hypothetical protein ACOX4Y_08005 [Limnochordia bacterium]|jgi:ribosomal protein L7/L12|nr:hypothetical protein [Bacillota bacterium]